MSPRLFRCVFWEGGVKRLKFMKITLTPNTYCIFNMSHSFLPPLLSQVFVINLLRDSKYFHFRPVMDTYIQKHFAGALAYK